MELCDQIKWQATLGGSGSFTGGNNCARILIAILFFIAAVDSSASSLLLRVDPIPTYQVGHRDYQGAGLDFFSPNEPCALIAKDHNSRELINYTYHNPRGEVHKDYGLGCVFDVYYTEDHGYPKGTVLKNHHLQNWAQETLKCPNGYAKSYSGFAFQCVRSVVPAEPRCFKNPILIGDGSKLETVGFSLTSFGKFDYRLRYHSRLAMNEKQRSRFGHSVWSDGFSQRLHANKGTSGRRLMYFWAGHAGLVVFEIKEDGSIISSDPGYKLEQDSASNSGSWLVEDFADKKKYWFESDGRLLSLKTATGKILRFSYTQADESYTSDDALGQLASVEDDAGRKLEFSYNERGFVSSVVAQSGDELTFRYNESDLLTNVSLSPAGPAGLDNVPLYSFLYESEVHPYLLTGRADAEGTLAAAWTYDESGRAVTSSHANGAEYGEVDYSGIGAQPLSIVVTRNEFGKTSSHYFDVVYGKKRLVKVDGHASDNCAAANKEYNYYDNGTLKSKTDWEGNLTTYLRDDLGREISRTEAAGTVDARTITTEYHPTLNKPVKITEPGRVTTMTYDAEGRLLSNTTQSTVAP